MIWDPDISPEGLSGTWKGEAHGLGLYATGAYFVFDEDSTASDAKVMALQGGFSKDVNDSV
jgi:hypothetical protein